MWLRKWLSWDSNPGHLIPKLGILEFLLLLCWLEQVRDAPRMEPYL